MSLKDNSPSMSYISASGISVVWNDEIYMVADFHSCKKYIYWNVELPNQFNASNVMPNRSDKQFLVLVNDNGVATEVPNESIEVYYDGNSVQNIRDRIFGIYDNNEEFGDRFITIEQNIDGIKTSVGKVEADNKKLHEEVSRIEQKADSIDLSVKDIIKDYNDDKETNQLREELNGSIIQLNADLGVFKSEFTDYAKDNQISNEEKVKIDTQKEILNNSKVVVMGHVDKVVAIADANGLNEDKTALESSKKALELSHTNLINNMTNAVSDMIITPTDRTVIIDAFAKYSQRLMSLKNTCDDIVLLGMGGVIIEELARIGLKSDEIILSVSKTEESISNNIGLEKSFLQRNITDLINESNSLIKVIKSIFEDGNISEEDIVIITEKINNVDKEKLDIENKYLELHSNENISLEVKDLLKNEYDEFEISYKSMIDIINEIISDGLANEPKSSQAIININLMLSKLNSLHSVMVRAIDDIQKNEYQAEIDRAKDEFQAEIEGVINEVKDLDEYMNTAFKDGIIDHSERRILEEKIKEIEKEKIDVDKKYEDLYNNPDLI